MAAFSWGLTLTVAAAAFVFFERDAHLTEHAEPAHRRPGPRTRLGEGIIRSSIGLQFVGLLGYLVYDSLMTPCMPYTLTCYCLYYPGFVCYVLDRPRDGKWFGAHDLFHLAVIAGHLCSLIGDVADMHTHCAANVTRWGSAAGGW